MTSHSFHRTLFNFSAALVVSLFGLSTHAEIHILPPGPDKADSAVHPDLSGYWILNEEHSDDFQEKMQAMMKEARGKRGGKGSGMGGGSGKGQGGKGKGKGHGGGNKAGSGRGGNNPGLQDIQALRMARTVLDIRHRDPMFLLVTADGRTQRLFTDYRGMSISASGAIQQKLSTAGWEGSDLVVETTYNNGLRLLQRYRLEPQSKRLKVDSRIMLPSLSTPVHISDVYDAGSPDSDR